MVRVDEEFRTLIPPLTDDEFQRLERSILDEGVREPIITWNGVIVDGHNRYNITQKHALVCPTRERQFESRDAAKIWICKNQLGRRNLEPGQKAAIVIEQSEAEVREAARLRQVQAGIEHGRGNSKKLGVNGTQAIATVKQLDTEPEKGRTAEILAKRAGVGEATVKRVLKVKREDPELYDKVRSGEVSTYAAYQQTTKDKPAPVKKATRTKAEYAEDGRRVCAICAEPIDNGDCYESRPQVHKKCYNKRNYQANTQYNNPEKSLLENVAVYTVDSLMEELKGSADMLREAWDESIEINESMGVKLTAADKKRLEKAATNLLVAIQKIKEG